jgi:hypothetical protein
MHEHQRFSRIGVRALPSWNVPIVYGNWYYTFSRSQLHYIAGRNCVPELPLMNDGSPSPLNGERVGVRGGKVRARLLTRIYFFSQSAGNSVATRISSCTQMNFDPRQNSAISNWN